MAKDQFEEDLLTESEEENSDEDFIESYTAKQRRRKKNNDLDLGYLKDEVQNIFIYPLTTLNGKNIDSGVRISNEKTTILITNIDQVKQFKSYSEDIYNYDLNELVDASDPTEKLIKNIGAKNVSMHGVEKIDAGLIYLITLSKLTKENFDDTKKFLGKTITGDIDQQTTDLTFVPIDEFSSLLKSQPILVFLSNPIKNKIKAINISSPTGTLIGNIKAINENGQRISLIANSLTDVYPKIVFPFQLQPHLSTVEYWASNQILKFKEIFDYLDSKQIKYNEEFSLADFLKLGSEVDYPPIHLDNARRIRFKIPKIKFDYFQSPDGSQWESKENEIDDYFDINIEDFFKLLVIESEWTAKQPNFIQTLQYERWVVKGPTGNDVSFNVKNFKADEIIDIDLYQKNVSKTTSAFQAICQMMTESFWKDLEFEGSIKVVEKEGQRVEEIDDPDIYKLREKYAGQDRYAVTTNAWISWKRKNPDLVNENLDVIKRIENSLALLSGVIKSNYSINKGDNDDYKILLPWYFEIQNKLDNPSRYTEYKDIIVKLKSAYGEFTENSFNFTNKNISKSKIFELEYNYFVFPEVTKKLEVAMIPSSMPLDQQLSNGEYSKYQLFNFAKDSSKKDFYMQRYGSGDMSNDSLIINNIDNQGEFNLESLSIVSEIEISSMYGFGKWIIELIDEVGNKFMLQTNLFSRFDNAKSLISLIL